MSQMRHEAAARVRESIAARIITGSVLQLPKVHTLPVCWMESDASRYHAVNQWDAFIMSAHPPVLLPRCDEEPACRTYGGSVTT